MRTGTLNDSYLDKEEAFCLQDVQAAIRREQCSGWKNRSNEGFASAQRLYVCKTDFMILVCYFGYEMSLNII